MQIISSFFNLKVFGQLMKRENLETHSPIGLIICIPCGFFYLKSGEPSAFFLLCYEYNSLNTRSTEIVLHSPICWEIPYATALEQTGDFREPEPLTLSLKQQGRELLLLPDTGQGLLRLDKRRVERWGWGRINQEWEWEKAISGYSTGNSMR